MKPFRIIYRLISFGQIQLKVVYCIQIFRQVQPPIIIPVFGILIFKFVKIVTLPGFAVHFLHIAFLEDFVDFCGQSAIFVPFLDLITLAKYSPQILDYFSLGPHCLFHFTGVHHCEILLLRQLLSLGPFFLGAQAAGFFVFFKNG